MLNESLISIFARRALGELQSEEIVDWAVAELVAGRDTPELCVLAGISPPFYASEVNEQFVKTLDELEITPPDKENCFRLYARQIAQVLLDDKITPPLACDILCDVYYDSYDSDYAIWGALHRA